VVKQKESMVKDQYRNICEVISIKSSVEEIFRKRKKITELLLLKSYCIKSEVITGMAIQDLELLYELYDQIFFNNLISSSFEGKFKFSLSKRMTKSAGMTICPKNIGKLDAKDIWIDIRIGIEFFYHYNQLEGKKMVGGYEASNAVEALLLVFEHELCHAIEFMLFHKSSCSKERFKSIAYNLFHHTESSHTLPTYKKIAQQKLGLNIGDKVTFEFEDRTLNGILYNINKRATVMVRDNNGRMVDSAGNRYAKYYVPLKLLADEK
jgi:hypothetical protein